MAARAAATPSASLAGFSPPPSAGTLTVIDHTPASPIILRDQRPFFESSLAPSSVLGRKVIIDPPFYGGHDHFLVEVMEEVVKAPLIKLQRLVGGASQLLPLGLVAVDTDLYRATLTRSERAEGRRANHVHLRNRAFCRSLLPNERQGKKSRGGNCDLDGDLCCFSANRHRWASPRKSARTARSASSSTDLTA